MYSPFDRRCVSWGIIARLHRKVTRHLASLYTLPDTNPVSTCIQKLPRQGKTYSSPLRVTWAKHKDILQQKEVRSVPQSPPWIDKEWIDRTRLASQSSETEAVQNHMVIRMRTGCSYYTDGSVRNGFCGSAVVLSLIHISEPTRPY